MTFDRAADRILSNIMANAAKSSPPLRAARKRMPKAKIRKA
jgi:hypothetical protein